MCRYMYLTRLLFEADYSENVPQLTNQHAISPFHCCAMKISEIAICSHVYYSRHRCYYHHVAINHTPRVMAYRFGKFLRVSAHSDFWHRLNYKRCTGNQGQTKHIIATYICNRVLATGITGISYLISDPPHTHFLLLFIPIRSCMTIHEHKRNAYL